MIRSKLRTKVLLAFVILAVLPLSFIVYYSSLKISKMENFLKSSTTEALDSMATSSLELRAEMVSSQVTQFLESVEGDVRELALLPVSELAYEKFNRANRKEVWYLDGDREKHEKLSLYSEISFIAADGQEQVKIQNDIASDKLINVLNPANTEYKADDFFNKVTSLGDGSVYVGRLIGWHSNKNSKTEPLMGIKYRGYIRFAMPIYKDGELFGVVSLALNHRHLMEFTQHITPAEENYVVFPSYTSGNYSFMFDDEGWIIAHPKHWDIRGVDKNGELVPPYSEYSKEESIASGDIPYNLNFAGFIHKNYPLAAQAVLSGLSGIVDVTNVGGAEKIMAYAPIRYGTGVYSEKGIFGGITIGSEVQRFHQPAYSISEVIKHELRRFVSSAWLLVCVLFVIVLLVSYRLSYSITEPLHKLFIVTKNMARGDLSSTVEISSNDEVGQLGHSFNVMAYELETRRAKLVKSLEELQQSRESLIKEESFKTTIFENIETGVITLDEKNIISFINLPAKNILGVSDNVLGKELCKALKIEWAEIVDSLDRALRTDDETKWDGYAEMERKGRKITFRLAVLPLHYESLHGRIFTIEDVTERVNMREQVGRMDRLASMGRLSASLAHEIRNPLTGISMMLDDLHDRLIGNHDDQHLIQRSMQEIERLESLVNELLSFARAHKPQLTQGDIASVLDDTIFLVKKQCERQQVKITADISDGISDFAMDKPRLKQAFLNIVTNALDAMPKGGSITVSATQSDSTVIVRFRDTGTGIDKDKIPLIFEPFYTSKREGSGLGLAITHNILSDHNAEVKVTSDENETEFLISFPI